MAWSDRSRRPAGQSVQFAISDFGFEMGFCPISDSSCFYCEGREIPEFSIRRLPLQTAEKPVRFQRNARSGANSGRKVKDVRYATIPAVAEF